MYSEAERKKAIKAFKKAIPSSKSPVKNARESYEELFASPFLPNNADIKEIEAGEVACDIISTDFAFEAFTILYAHGGGFVAGSRCAYRNFCASLAHEAACRLVLPEYRLAPEHPYPAALEDIYTAYAWTLREMAKPSSVILSGDGAGGNLALSLVHFLKAKNLPLPAALLLFSPWADLSTNERKKDKKNPDPVLTPQTLSWQALQYTFRSNRTKAGISPIFGGFEDFPPMYIQCGSCELLAEDSRRLEKKAREGGCEASLEIFPGMWHFFQGFDSATPEALAAVKKAGDWVRSIQKRARGGEKRELP